MSDENTTEETNEPLSLKTETVQVTLLGENGEEIRYELREPSGLARDEYLNILSSRIQQPGTGGKQDKRDFKGVQSSLLTKMLFDEEGKMVKADVIDGWPARVRSALFAKAQALAGLGKPGEEAVKN